MDTQKLNELTLKTMEFFKGDAKRIQHFIKVNAFLGSFVKKKILTRKLPLLHLLPRLSMM